MLTNLSIVGLLYCICEASLVAVIVVTDGILLTSIYIYMDVLVSVRHAGLRLAGWCLGIYVFSCIW